MNDGIVKVRRREVWKTGRKEETPHKLGFIGERKKKLRRSDKKTNDWKK